MFPMPYLQGHGNLALEEGGENMTEVLVEMVVSVVVNVISGVITYYIIKKFF